MYMDLSSFQQRKESVLASIQRLYNAAKMLNRRDITLSLKETSDQLRQDHFSLVVVGEFSRGKSTFINAMLGRRILPSSPKPTTTILNLIHYSDEPVYELYYRAGEQSPVKITEDRFKAIVAAMEPVSGDENEEKAYQLAVAESKAISYARIGYPAAMLQDQVVIVDTPGTNDLDTAREEITYKFIPQSDAAIFVLSARQAVTQSEMEFLKNRILKADIQKIFFVLNAKDSLDGEEEQRKVFAYTEQSLRDVVPHPRIFMASSKHALAARRAARGEEVKGEVPSFQTTGFPEFETALGEFLTAEKGSAKLSKPIGRSIRLAVEMLDQSIPMERAAMQLTLEQLEAKIRTLQPEIDRYEKSTQTILAKCSQRLEQLHGMEIEQFLRSGLDQIAHSAVQATQQYSGELTKEAFLASIEKVVAPKQTRLQEEIHTRQNRYLDKEWNAAYTRYRQEWGELEGLFRDQFLNRDNERILSVSDSLQIQISDTRNEDQNVGLLIGAGGIASLMLIPLLSLIPVAIGGLFLFSFFKENQKQKMLAKLRIQVEKRFLDSIPDALQKFRDEWKDQVKKVAHVLEAEMLRKSEGLKEQLAQLLQEKREELTRSEDRLQLLARLEEQLKLEISALHRQQEMGRGSSL